MAATKTNKNDLKHNYIQNVTLFRFSGKNASPLNFLYSLFIPSRHIPCRIESYRWLVWNRFAHAYRCPQPTPPPEERKKRHCILFCLTCWQECVSYYVKRNWFWWMLERVKPTEMKTKLKKECRFTRCTNLSLFLFLPYLFAVCVRFTMNARESNIALRINCIHQQQQ